MIRAQWPSMPGTEMRALSSSLGYEGDAHVVIFPGVPILWLDAGRTSSSPVDEYAKGRLSLYLSHTRGMYPPSLEAISESMRKVACFHPDERDALFASRITSEVSARNAAWAITITGWGHAQVNIPDSMGALLSAASFDCEQIELWSPCR